MNRPHHCHAIDCQRTCKPEHLMCFQHWSRVPPALKREVWKQRAAGLVLGPHYNTGQCVGQAEVTPAWHLADNKAIAHVAVAEGVWTRERADAWLRRSTSSSSSSSEPSPSHLLLLDATNLAHRFFHAPGPRPPHEAFGFALSRFRGWTAATHGLAVWDGQGPTWRHELWPEYKAARPPKPEGLAAMLERCRDECSAAGLRSVDLKATEADDMIASYVEAAIRQDLSVTIVSADKDLLQLVRGTAAFTGASTSSGGPTVEVLDPRGRRWGPSEVLERFGVWPHSLADLLALAGDGSDCIPGLEGIGPKTAARLISTHGDLHRLLERADYVANKRHRKRLTADAEKARLFYRLTSLVRTIPLPVQLEQTKWAAPGRMAEAPRTSL